MKRHYKILRVQQVILKQEVNKLKKMPLQQKRLLLAPKQTLSELP